ncbi:TIGR02269 family lipoprotein [Archangium primigenium]|uniref:TIGR02269 family lipoprotein n=1 Tax=[Archangium] primigenium TaxID=2792470 RepID=UPI001EF95C51|nr:TIGR02269 family lipoprotein [Archangium primigenium]
MEQSGAKAWSGLLLTLVLLSTGCASLTPPPGPGTSLRYTPRETTERASTRRHGVEPSRPRGSTSAPEEPERIHRHRTAQEALAAQLAFRGALRELSSSTSRISHALSQLKAQGRGLSGKHADLFVQFIDFGTRQMRWIDIQRVAATSLANTASEVEAPDLQLALLRMAGPRLEAAMLGSILLATWLDCLHLVDALLDPFLYSVERMARDLRDWREMLEPKLGALSSLVPDQLEATAHDIPALVGHLSDALATLVSNVREKAEFTEKVLVLRDLLLSVPLMLEAPLLASEASSASALLGVGLTVGGDGVMMGTRLVVSAEWVEMMRRLIHAGVLSLPAVTAAVRIHAGGTVLAQAHGELPRGVRDALGDGPEVRAMRATGKAGAGMAEPPRHHVMPKEFRSWFEKRGFTGEMDINQFCVEMERAHHEAIHGGGHWKLGRAWSGEWNRMIMKALRDAEAEAGRMLTRNEVMDIVADRMRFYDIPMNFSPWGR